MKITFPCMLLLLPVTAQLTFEQKHITPAMQPDDCDNRMTIINNGGQTCKPSNSFILGTVNAIREVCQEMHNGKVISNEKQTFNIVYCGNPEKKDGQCKYQDKYLLTNKRIDIICTDGEPVHYIGYVGNM